SLIWSVSGGAAAATPEVSANRIDAAKTARAERIRSLQAPFHARARQRIFRIGGAPPASARVTRQARPDARGWLPLLPNADGTAGTAAAGIGGRHALLFLGAALAGLFAAIATIHVDGHRFARSAVRGKRNTAIGCAADAGTAGQEQCAQGRSHQSQRDP